MKNKKNNISPSRFQMGIIRRLGIDKYLEERERNKIWEIDASNDDGDTFKMMENRVWFEADTGNLEFFYKTHYRDNIYRSHEFWREVNTNMPRVHYPMASTISSAFGSLLFSNNPTFVIDSGSVARDKEYGKRLEKILDINDMLSLLQNAAALQSYSGAVGMKLNVDTTLADVPLISIYPKEKIKTHKKYGQTIYIDFIDDYKGGYRLITRYGLGYINYRLFKGKDPVSLSALPETKDLKDVAFMDKSGNLLPVMFAVVVQNKAGEKSDYEGLISSFHALDEVYSTMINYIRKTKPNIFITEDIRPIDGNGNKLPLNEFDTVITLLDGTPSGEETKIDRDVVDVKIRGYREAFETIRETILTKVSLSPGTLGLPSGGARESSMALNIRERASMRSRNEKLAIWSEKLNTFLYCALILDKIVREATPAADGIYQVDSIDDFLVRSDFGHYTEMGVAEKLDLYKEALANKMCSVEFAIIQTFGDQLSDVELMFLIIQTKEQNGIELSTEEKEFLAAQENRSSRTRFSILNYRSN